MPRKQDRLQDRNFDDIADRFKRNIYDGLKGHIRLQILQRDLAPFLQSKALHILDAGGGQGQFSLALSKLGHHVTLCDISQEMLLHAQQTIDTEKLQNVRLLHCPLQTMHEHMPEPADVVLSHAVLEWLAEPKKALEPLLRNLKPRGILSLSFYNVHSIVFKNALRTNYQKIFDEDFYGDRGSLTPINPLHCEEVLRWCKEADLQVLVQSGIRVFYDYILDPQLRDMDADNLLKAELKYSQIEPFRSLGRYIHLVLQRQV